MSTVLDFEKPIVELEKKITELRTLSADGNLNLESEVKKLESRLAHVKKETYGALTAWQRVQIARHPKRPYTLDYVQMLFTDFVELHGDRTFADDKALIGGLAKFEGRPVLVMGHQKGRDAKENIMRNFGSAHPEGYRKALRLMGLAERFSLPIVVFIDTPGAYPGVGAEERGQAYAIAVNIRDMARVKAPIVVYVIGEGGSGGALGIGVGDRVSVLENAYYSVISPEGCAAILWKDRTKAPEAAQALRLTGRDLFELKLIDEVLKEPLGGAHLDPAAMAETMRQSLRGHLEEIGKTDVNELVETRYEHFRAIGHYRTGLAPASVDASARPAKKRREKKVSSSQ